MRLRAAKLHVYAVQQADGLSATFSMLHCCVAAGLDGSSREMQNCYNSQKHVKQQAAVGLDVALDTWVVNQWTAVRAISDPTAHQAMLRAAAKGYLAGAVGYDTHLAAATSAGLDVVPKRGHVSGDVQQLKRRLTNWTSADDSDNAGDSDNDDDGGGGGGGGGGDGGDGGDGGGGGGGGGGGDDAAAGGSAATGGGDVNLDVGSGRRGRSGRKCSTLVLGDHPPAKPYGKHGVAKDEYDHFVVVAAREIAGYRKGKQWAMAGELSEELSEEHGCLVGQKTLFNYSKKPDVVPSRPGDRGLHSSTSQLNLSRF